MPFWGTFYEAWMEFSLSSLRAQQRIYQLHFEPIRCIDKIKDEYVFSEQFETTHLRKYQDLACYLNNRIAIYIIIRSACESDLIQILDQDLQSTFASWLGHQRHLPKEVQHCCVLMSNVGADTKLVLLPSFHFHETIVSHLSVQLLMDY